MEEQWEQFRQGYTGPFTDALLSYLANNEEYDSYVLEHFINTAHYLPDGVFSHFCNLSLAEMCMTNGYIEAVAACANAGLLDDQGSEHRSLLQVACDLDPPMHSYQLPYTWVNRVAPADILIALVLMGMNTNREEWQELVRPEDIERVAEVERRINK